MRRITFLSLLNGVKRISAAMLLCILFLPVEHTNAQTLVGMTELYGDSAGGTLFGYNVSTAHDSLFYQFPLGAEYPRYGNLVQAKDGNLYGMTCNGGVANAGTLFKFDMTTFATTILIQFNDTNGANPYGSLIQATDGNLYGMTSMGGSSNNGTIFKYNIASGKLITLINFSNNEYPYGSLMQALDSNLYGMTNGQTYNGGYIFKYNISSGILTNLVSFNGSNGANPYGSLMQGKDSNFYGMTYKGGTSGDGTIFKCTTSGIITTLVNFNGTNGKNPYGNLIQAYDSNLYGMTYSGGTGGDGVVFKYQLSTATYTTLANFSLFEYPYGSLVQGKDSNLYGMTYMAGAFSNGTVFKCSTSGTMSTLVVFNRNGARYPQGSLIQATDGNFYGLSYQSDRTGLGTIFLCTPGGGYATLYYMGITNIGSTPYASVIQGTDGNLYGMTYAGGSQSDGTVFQYNTTNGAMKTIASLGGGYGAHPYGSLVQATDGNLYGMTYEEGGSNNGTIFKCSTSGAISTLVAFNGTNGGLPVATLIQASDGNLYGMTTYGGTNNSGTLFECTLAGSLTTLINYNSGDSPESSLIQGFDGDLYGTTYGGGTSSKGTIFQYKPHGTYNRLVSFTGTGTNGANPICGVIQGKDSCLYGMTYQGGTFGYGTIFKCTTTGTLTTLVNFNSTNGANPYGKLMQASDGNLYGMTVKGGSGFGTLFKCTTTGTLTTLLKFTKATGTSPQWGNLLELKGTVTSVNNISIGNNVSVYPNPAMTELNIACSKTNAPAEIKVIDIMGKELISTSLMVSNGKAIQINISSLAQGIYFVKVTTEKGTEVAKFIKQ